MGFPGSFDYLPTRTEVYFNRSDVQRAINAPIQDWAECTSVNVFVNGTDNSPPSGLSVLPSVIDRAERTIIGHGLLDYILLYNSTLLAIQNMTFGGS
jgi:carboxypeptidase D